FTNLTPFTHFYASVPGQTVGYVLTLTVDDARGGQKSIQRDVVLTANSAGQQLVVQLQQTHACGCRTMTVFSRTPAVAGQVNGTSGVYCEAAGVDPTKLPQYPGCRALTAQQIEQLPARERCPQGRVA